MPAALERDLLDRDAPPWQIVFGVDQKPIRFP